jgi:hypothetical protein
VPRVDRQAFAVNRSITSARGIVAPVGELVGDEVHAPDLVAGDRGPELLAMHRCRLSPRALPPEREAFLGVQTKVKGNDKV